MTTISVPVELEAPFLDLAQRTGRAMDDLIWEAMANYLEDMADAEDANRLYREFKDSGEPGISWERVKAELDLKHGL
ncbi:MAG: hypothetical protein HQL82_17345 [Magnetococcales bacterium]|nr:hypothetical protein [Magnetococcales bacterium]